MKKGVKFTLFLFLLALIFIGVSGVRIYSINKETPNSFDIQTFKQDEVVSLNNLAISFVSSKMGEKSHFDGGNPDDQYTLMPLTVELKVKNTSEVNQDITTLFESQLMVGYSPYNTTDIQTDLKLLKPQEATMITMTFTIDATLYDKDDTYLVIGTRALLNFDKENYTEQYNDRIYEGIVFKV